MSKCFLATLFVMAFLSAPAFAGDCPNMMSAIDEAMASAQLSDEDKAKVMELRAKGEEEHKGGNHDASIATLAEAKAVLGIE
ncbi:MAG: hypothetical protein ACR2RB_17040 [Gammaproteobacteria bacterium]